MIRATFLQSIAAVAAASGAAATSRPPFRIGTLVEFALPSPEGKTIDLAAYRGYPVLVNFFASWCGECVAEQPTIGLLAREFYGKGLRVIGIDSGESVSMVLGYRSRFAIDYPIAMDIRDDVSAKYATDTTDGAIALPMSLFLDSSGRIVHWAWGRLNETWARSILPALIATKTAP